MKDMPQHESDPNAKNDLGINDEIAQAQFERAIKQYHKEIATFKDTLEKIDIGRKRMAEQWAVDNELWNIQLRDDNHKRIEPVFKYELDPRFDELRYKKIQWQYESDKHQAESYDKGYDVQIETVTKQLKSAEEALAKAELLKQAPVVEVTTEEAEPVAIEKVEGA